MKGIYKDGSIGIFEGPEELQLLRQVLFMV